MIDPSIFGMINKGTNRCMFRYNWWDLHGKVSGEPGRESTREHLFLTLDSNLRFILMNDWSDFLWHEIMGPIFTPSSPSPPFSGFLSHLLFLQAGFPHRVAKRFLIAHLRNPKGWNFTKNFMDLGRIFFYFCPGPSCFQEMAFICDFWVYWMGKTGMDAHLSLFLRKKSE